MEYDGLDLWLSLMLLLMILFSNMCLTYCMMVLRLSDLNLATSAAMYMELVTTWWLLSHLMTREGTRQRDAY